MERGIWNKPPLASYFTLKTDYISILIYYIKYISLTIDSKKDEDLVWFDMIFFFERNKRERDADVDGDMGLTSWYIYIYIYQSLRV